MSSAPDSLPAEHAIAGLQALLNEPDEEARARRAWPLVVRAGGDSDFAVVHDFALEHGLIAALDGGRSSRRPASVLWTNPIDGSQMVWIPPGPFLVGKEKRRAASPGFSLARHPVTNAQFKAFLDATGYVPSAEDPTREDFLHHWADGSGPAVDQEQHPVVWVSFLDALAYCKWAGLALPTEWLWEKAARGPDGRDFPWGNDWPSGKKLTHIGAADTCPVGSYPRTRTPYGCEDMVGNSSEWCRMIEGEDFGQVPNDWPDVQPALEGEIVYATVRGACFLRTNGNVSWHRRRLQVIRRNKWVGFRPACFLPCRPAK
ncbi:MAG: formylglycine-generating enzyme family protein [Gemmataceae bacterium]|nr:formylglycine-generating enzyme family protein [Gemmataceae bacterium]